MKVEVVLTEADIAQEFFEAIEARDLPEKFFFWFPRSAAEWAALTGHAELYGGLWETWKELAANAGALAKYFPRRVPVISFGAGDGARDRMVMNALKNAGCECFYFPVDASQAMLELACAGADDEDIETVGIKADISSPIHLVYAADAAEPPRLFILSGNTMGSFDPLAEIRYVAQCMKPEDLLIIDGEIHHEQLSMARRDNPAARQFLTTLLNGVGILDNDGEVHPVRHGIRAPQREIDARIRRIFVLRRFQLGDGFFNRARAQQQHSQKIVTFRESRSELHGLLGVGDPGGRVRLHHNAGNAQPRQQMLGAVLDLTAEGFDSLIVEVIGEQEAPVGELDVVKLRSAGGQPAVLGQRRVHVAAGGNVLRPAGPPDDFSCAG